jgi:hypothetical protein
MADAIQEVLDVALRVAEALEAVGARYFIGGSLASSMQGEPRATNDIDIVIDMPLGSVSAFAKALGDDFEVDEVMLRDAMLRGEWCQHLLLAIRHEGGPVWSCARAFRRVGVRPSSADRGVARTSAALEAERSVVRRLASPSHFSRVLTGQRNLGVSYRRAFDRFASSFKYPSSDRPWAAASFLSVSLRGVLSPCSTRRT